jgi:hypothetical protein
MTQPEHALTGSGLSQCDRILAELESKRGQWVPMPDPDSIAGAYTVHSCIADLRKRGHRIEAMQERRGRKVWSYYRLEAIETLKAQGLTPPQPSA